MKIILNDKVTFKDLISTLDNYGQGFLALVNDSNYLVGIITDGDIRRAVLNDLDDIEKIINKKPITLQYGTHENKIRRTLKQKHLRHMPLIDSEGKLIDVFIINESDVVEKPNRVYIMAGGLGKRLGKLTAEKPKPMINVGTKPIITLIIEAFKEHGYLNFTICVNYKSEIIKNYLKNGDDLNVNIDYIEEEEFLGTAGSLGLITKKESKPFFVINSDVITALNFEKLMTNHIESSTTATMCLSEIEIEVPYGVVNVDNDQNILNFQEKPIKKFLINSGIYVLNPSVLSFIPYRTFFDMPSLFKILISKNKNVKVFKIKDYWSDVGTVEDLGKANDKFEKITKNYKKL